MTFRGSYLSICSYVDMRAWTAIIVLGAAQAAVLPWKRQQPPSRQPLAAQPRLVISPAAHEPFPQRFALEALTVVGRVLYLRLLGVEVGRLVRSLERLAVNATTSASAGSFSQLQRNCSDTRFEDVEGVEEVKGELKEAVERRGEQQQVLSRTTRGRVSTAESDAKIVPRDDARGVAGRPPRAVRRRRGGRWRGGRILRGLAKEVEKLVEERLAQQRHARRRREGGPAPGLAGHGGRRGPPHPKL